MELRKVTPQRCSDRPDAVRPKTAAPFIWLQARPKWGNPCCSSPARYVMYSVLLEQSAHYTSADVAPGCSSLVARNKVPQLSIRECLHHVNRAPAFTGRVHGDCSTCCSAPSSFSLVVSCFCRRRTLENCICTAKRIHPSP